MTTPPGEDDRLLASVQALGFQEVHFQPGTYLSLDVHGNPAGNSVGLTRGTIVTRVRKRGREVWGVSFRPSPGGSGLRYYTDAVEAVRAVRTRRHTPHGRKLRDL